MQFTEDSQDYSNSVELFCNHIINMDKLQFEKTKMAKKYRKNLEKTFKKDS